MVTEVLYRLDNLDLALIRELESNARQGYPDLASKLGTSSTTVHRRLHRLLNKSVIDIVAMVDPVALGYHTRAGIGINTRPGQVDDVAQKLAALGAVQHIIITTGRYDIIAWGIFRDYEALLGFISEGVGMISDVTSAETMLVLKPVKTSWAYLESDGYNLVKSSTPRVLDGLDLALVKEVEISPRQTITGIARKLGISISGTSRKLQALFDEGIIKIVSIPNRAALGYSVRAVTLVKVHPREIHTVADEVAHCHNINQVAMISGAFDLLLSGFYRSSEDMYEFLRNRLGLIPGVMRHETMTHIKIAKRSFSLLAHQAQD